MKKINALVLALIAVLCASVLFIGYFFLPPFLVIHNADAGFGRAKRTVDPELLRVWAFQEILKYPVTNKAWGAREIPKSEIPSQIQTLYSISPSYAVVRSESNSEPYVQIYWSGASDRFRWWFTIGSTNFLTSPDGSGYYQKAVWVKGVYYNRENKLEK
jgi:hypothetical protein